ncbi:hypothetical protein L6452_08741 [Arctium lappa]|uniref:Uncharacterized protein n=1 Tax=Arctium lappa TaxID=4217 RepID=A0ACB9DIY7_ARCLA|nr:hypothetical protein L6452_08741 [Arctium lappa]
MEGGGSKLYRNSLGELGFEASNIGMEGNLATTTTRRSEITTDGSSGGCATGSGQCILIFKRKRGRPRKYDANGNFIRPSVQSPSLPLSPLPPNHLRGYSTTTWVCSPSISCHG